MLIGDVVPFIGARPNPLASKANTVVKTKSGYDVQIKATEFPELTPYMQLSAELSDMQGNDADYIAANAAAFPDIFANHNLTIEQQKWVHKWADNGKYADYTWHHHEDGRTMQLVPTDLNNPSNGGVVHSGGSAVTKHNTKFPQHPLSLPSPSPSLSI